VAQDRRFLSEASSQNKSGSLSGTASSFNPVEKTYFFFLAGAFFAAAFFLVAFFID
jgi:hypothetical protein